MFAPGPAFNLDLWPEPGSPGPGGPSFRAKGPQNPWPLLHSVQIVSRQLQVVGKAKDVTGCYGTTHAAIFVLLCLSWSLACPSKAQALPGPLAQAGHPRFRRSLKRQTTQKGVNLRIIFRKSRNIEVVNHYMVGCV